MNPIQPKQKRGVRAGTAIVVVLAWVAILLAVGYNRQALIDWWRLKHYQPPQAVAQLATDDTMTAAARKIWYVNSPQLQPKAAFVECKLGNEQAAVLGCYHGNQNGIFVLMVSDSRLQGVEQVTAAHEMLHAAYDRLGTKEKHHINALLEDYYHHGLHDATIMSQMKGYEKSEPNDVVNEMHSVFATEVDTLPAPLEQYYRQYFSDRAKVTGYYDAYEGEFTSRQAQIKADDTRLAAMKSQIDTMESELKGKYSVLQSQQSQLQTLRASGATADYNARVPAYNQLVNDYNDEISQLKSLTEQYNQLVDTRNGIALETQKLASEITTNPSPIK